MSKTTHAIFVFLMASALGILAAIFVKVGRGPKTDIDQDWRCDPCPEPRDYVFCVQPDFGDGITIKDERDSSLRFEACEIRVRCHL